MVFSIIFSPRFYVRDHLPAGGEREEPRLASPSQSCYAVRSIVPSAAVRSQARVTVPEEALLTGGGQYEDDHCLAAALAPTWNHCRTRSVRLPHCQDH